MKARSIAIHTFSARQGNVLTAECRNNTNDRNTWHSTIIDNEYRLYELLQPGDWVIDIGAHTGSVSCLAAKLGAKVIAVEPLPENISLLKKNLIHNGLQNKVSVHQRAAHGLSDKTITIYYRDLNKSGQHQFIGHEKPLVDSGEALEVKTITLSEVLSLKKIDHCRVLKVDCEGGEWSIFQDLEVATLEKIDILVAELHIGPEQGRTFEEFLPLLKGKFKEVKEYTEFSGDCAHIMLQNISRKLKWQ